MRPLALLAFVLVLSGCATSGPKPLGECPEDRKPVAILAGQPPAFPQEDPPLYSGWAAAECTVTLEGLPSDCRLLYAPPDVGAPFLASLETLRFAEPRRCGAPSETQTVVRLHYRPPPHARAVVADEADIPPFAEGMTKPVRLSGANPAYTSQMLEEGVNGMSIVNCVIEVDGSLQECFVVKSLPGADESVIAALRTWRMTPVTFQGKPIKARYTFNINLRIPRW